MNGEAEAVVDGVLAWPRDRAATQAPLSRGRLARRLRLVLDALPAGVIVLDGDGRVVEANPAANAIFGEALAGVLWREAARRLVASGRGEGSGLSLANGRRVELTTCSLGDEPGQILLVHDVTERSRLEARLARAKRLSELGQMMAALAHELRTPLASALLYASHLEAHAGRLASGSVRGAALARTASRLVARLRGLERLVDDLLLFARHGRLDVESLPVAELLGRLHAVLDAHAPAGGAASRVDPALSGATLVGNAEALERVAGNLARNAAEAGATRLALAARLRPPAAGEAERLELRFADDGRGMEPELAARAFEPFVSARAGGVGLGLAVVRRVIEAHGGEVTLASSPGAGSTVTICLPLAHGAQAQPGERRRA